MKNLLLRTPAVLAALLLVVSSFGCKPHSQEPQQPEVKNIILMVGDGMGAAQISALMLADENAPVNMERATVGGFVKTRSADNRVTDSAAAATAYSTGEKTNNGHLSVNPEGAPLETILEKAENAGMPTGLVVTINIQHATPAAFYAHNPDRNDYEDIALGLLDSGIDVAIGGGIRYMTDREDGRDLMKELEANGYTVADNLNALASVTSGQAVALYDEVELAADFMSSEAGRDVTLLSRGTSKALEILAANSAAAGKGFFAMIEGSWIDSAGHANDEGMLMGEMRDFDNAVGVAFDYADTHPGTLVIVLADHETGGLTIPSGNENFLLPDSGIEFSWATGGHTATMVPMLTYGTGASAFGGIIDNTEVNRRMESILGLE